MIDLLKFLVVQFIDSPDSLKITETEGEEKTVLTVFVSVADMGKIIGKNGRIAKAIRTIVKSAGSKNGKKYSVEITELS